ARAVALALAGAVLSGCSNDVGSSGGQGYVAGNGVITTLEVADREPPGPVEGTTLDGRRASLSDYRGKVVVVNVWGSWCPPCRAEAPILADAARAYADDGVVFLGINSRDAAKAAPRAFERRYRVPYDSIYDPDGRTLLAFSGTLSPKAIPSTVIIDREGRVAASVLGDLTRTTLDDLIEDVSGSQGGAGA
ncbi:MAG TPA: TlpA disulfide reductase family protein, partial [Nocardioidaceae bacterium]|nr:TlpA disulfide reductase family protein [Nocardioidaceae bacterium]